MDKEDSNKTVQINDLESLDDELMEEVTYHGALFTGTAVYENERVKEEYHFLDGKAHGRWTMESRSGQLLEESFYENGKLQRQQAWTKEGILHLRYQTEPLSHEEFYPDGSIQYHRTDDGLKKYYQNGQPLEVFEYAAKLAVFYDKSGTWLLRHQTEGKQYVVISREKITFHDEALRQSWLVLLEEAFDEFAPYIALWLEELSLTERADIVCAMIASDNLWIKEKGIRLAEQHKIVQALPLLEKERNNQAVPPRRFHGTGMVSYSMTISLRARQAIGTLKKEDLLYRAFSSVLGKD